MPGAGIAISLIYSTNLTCELIRSGTSTAWVLVPVREKLRYQYWQSCGTSVAGANESSNEITPEFIGRWFIPQIT